MRERFPNWETRIQYWEIGDVAVVQPNKALALIDAQVEDLLANFRPDSWPQLRRRRRLSLDR